MRRNRFVPASVRLRALGVRAAAVEVRPGDAGERDPGADGADGDAEGRGRVGLRLAGRVEGVELRERLGETTGGVGEHRAGQADGPVADGDEVDGFLVHVRGW